MSSANQDDCSSVSNPLNKPRTLMENLHCLINRCNTIDPIIFSRFIIDSSSDVELDDIYLMEMFIYEFLAYLNQIIDH